MPTYNLHIGSFGALYVGDYPSGVLEPIPVLGTGPQKVTWNMEEAHLWTLGKTVQAGPQQITANLSFLSDDPYALKLANGLAVSATVADASSTFSEYTLLLAHVDETAHSSILIPRCTTLKNFDMSFDKSAPTSVSLTFSHKDPDRSARLYYKRPLSELATILGVRSPV